ncbi:MraW methylase family protein [Heracleum sosnowskyi]|uniref:MraW methylase family protein n=1 Tax=Heracleum sosnowskyi TaxID=360622 RepID=A0AAD8HTH2_9APIA|nr:MraW methylase family protein [Heracleum sosnowskyi]
MRVSSVATSTCSVLGSCSTCRRSIGGVVKLYKAQLSSDAVKRANLSSRKRERIKLPNYDDISGTKDMFHVREFLRHPSGIQSILNTSALQTYYSIDSNTYRCILPRLQLFNFQVSPELDLQVTPTTKYCLVEMLSCKFEGSEIVERQNEHFSASMTNTITWDTRDFDSYLNVDVRLNLSLEIYTKPFSLLPVSAVETPGNLRALISCRMMQALVDRLVPLLLQQLLQDYDKWVKQQCRNLPEDRVPN